MLPSKFNCNPNLVTSCNSGSRRASCIPSILKSLSRFDFSEANARLVATVRLPPPTSCHLLCASHPCVLPQLYVTHCCKQVPGKWGADEAGAWGCERLRRVLQNCRCLGSSSEIIMQCSSIGSLSEEWIAFFTSVLATSRLVC